MIENKIVLILGAGSSKPFGFPIGDELSRLISFGFKNQFLGLMSQYHEKDYAFWDTITIDVNSLVDNFSKTSLTIDAFLAINPQLADVGKKAIIYIISEKEKANKLPWEDKKITFDWIGSLFKKMIDGLPDLTYFANNKVSFITFNYDRLLEYILYQNLKSSFLKNKDSEIIEQLNCIPIIHVYGKIANLPWQGGHAYEYKHNFDFDTINRIKNNIHIVGEREFDEGIKFSHELIQQANIIYFLGFGYLKENLDILKIPEILNSNQRINGTAVNFSEKKIKDIKQKFLPVGEYNPGKCNILNKDCFNLLNDWL